MLWLVIIVVLNVVALENRRNPEEAFSVQAGAHFNVLTSYGFQ